MLSKCKGAAFRCKRMPEGLLTHCKAALSNLIASERVESADDPLTAFSDGILNFIGWMTVDHHGVAMRR